MLVLQRKANKAAKKIMPLDDANLTTHLLHMCPAKWQTQYNLMENISPVSTRVLLLMLKNIKNNAEQDHKHPKSIKQKGLKGSAIK